MSTTVSEALARRGVEERLVGGLALAAAPTFAAMALWSACAGSPDMICGARAASPIGEMTLMYLLMSAAHLAPWLRLVARQSSGTFPPR